MIEKAEAGRIEAHLRQLARFSDGETGVTRLPFSPAARKAVAYLTKKMQDAGLKVHVDATGAVHGLRPGKNFRRIILGSHYDSVPQGGAFDGIAGVVCGLEIARLLQDKELNYGLEIIAFNDEEGVRFGAGFLSSKALLGDLTVEDLQNCRDKEGISVYEAAKAAELTPDNLPAERWELPKIRAFLEIHIEQGGVLEYQQVPLGIVTGIVGMRRYTIEITGRADHAGTTPMDMRHDALWPAAAIINEARRVALACPGAVATVGSLLMSPNAVNTVADKVELSLDLRSMEVREVAHMEQQIFQALAEAAEVAAVTYDIKPSLASQPGFMDKELISYLQTSAKKKEIKTMNMHSGAGHDALPISAKVPTAMLFVPSKGGRSHCPEEWSNGEHLAIAVDVMLDTILKINQEESL